MSAVICAIVKHEDIYLHEWIQYYRKLGFAHIYFYDNSDDFSLREWASRYDGFITVTHFPGDVKQVPAYNSFISDYKNGIDGKEKHTWCAFIDADEFIVLKKHKNIADMLHEHCQSGGLALNWYLFGSSHRETYSPEPVVQRFTRRHSNIDHHVKTIMHLPSVTNMGVHDGDVHNGTFHDTNGNTVFGPFNQNGPSNIAVIHHYIIKSREEYFMKIKRGRADVNMVRTMDLWFETERVANDVEDLSALLFFDNITKYEIKEDYVKLHQS